MPMDEMELTWTLRDAIDEDEMKLLLEAAGAPRISGSATQVLHETSAALPAGWLSTAGVNTFAREPEHPVSGKLTRQARNAVDLALLLESPLPLGVTAEFAEAVVSEFMARTAVEAVAFARAEDRPVCHNCVAIGAARASRAFEAKPADAEADAGTPPDTSA